MYVRRAATRTRASITPGCWSPAENLGDIVVYVKLEGVSEPSFYVPESFYPGPAAY